MRRFIEGCCGSLRATQGCLNGEGMIQDRRAQTVSKLEEGSVRRRLR